MKIRMAFSPTCKNTLIIIMVNVKIYIYFLLVFVNKIV